MKAKGGLALLLGLPSKSSKDKVDAEEEGMDDAEGGGETGDTSEDEALDIIFRALKAGDKAGFKEGMRAWKEC